MMKAFRAAAYRDLHTPRRSLTGSAPSPVCGPVSFPPTPGICLSGPMAVVMTTQNIDANDWTDTDTRKDM